MAYIAARPNRSCNHFLWPALLLLTSRGPRPAPMASRLLSTLVYNPLHACGDRLTDICCECSSFDLVGLPGTQIREVNQEGYRVQQLGDRVAVHAGWRAGGHSNRAAG
eukprot:3593783-Pyramimonas_sp.AAC.1